MYEQLVLLVLLQVCFSLVRCRQGILSYDTPQQAMREGKTGNQISDETSQETLVTEDDSSLHYSDDSKDDEVTVECLQNSMLIAIPKSLLRGTDREHIRALDVDCGATDNLTHYILDVPLTSCGTKSRHTNSSIIYSNEALPVPPMAKDVVSHVPDFQIPFHCYYDSEGLVSGVGLMPRSEKVIFSEKGFGKFTMRLQLFPDLRFVGPYTQDDYPITLRLRQKIFFEASVDTIDHRLTILARECFATPSPDINSSPKYWIIKNGCKMDETLEYYPANERSERFSVESFKFIGEHPFVFVHCHIRVCNHSDPESKCVRICEDRSKRDVSVVQESVDDVYPLAQGPITLRKEEVKDEMATNTTRNGPTVPVIAMATALLALSALGAALLTKHKRKSVHEYKMLVEEIQG
ncbi:ZP domain-containing protein-like [Stylophora pistillata]|nr:ZP domain-containing protein-like [Stylophora pistillata]